MEKKLIILNTLLKERDYLYIHLILGYIEHLEVLNNLKKNILLIKKQKKK